MVVAESPSNVPFVIARMFTLHAPAGAERGHHAHRQCSQFMLCVHGAVNIICDYGNGRQTFVLARNNDALLVPPMIWNTVFFKKPESALVVLCDRPFEESDYIRDYSDFLKVRKAMQI